MSEELPRCPECGYTDIDARIHGDHYLCKGIIPGPERIFTWRKQNGRYWSVNVPTYRGGKATEYIRLDLHEALTAERDTLRAEVERLRGYLESMADPRDIHGFAVPYNAPGAGAQFVKLAQEALKGKKHDGK